MHNLNSCYSLKEIEKKNLFPIANGHMWSVKTLLRLVPWHRPLIRWDVNDACNEYVHLIRWDVNYECNEYVHSGLYFLEVIPEVTGESTLATLINIIIMFIGYI